uniref:Uncharacterized protein n=1 Tax=Setaria italica TaxID=4555 RepID=K3YBH8_SETIT
MCLKSRSRWSVTVGWERYSLPSPGDLLKAIRLLQGCIITNENDGSYKVQELHLPGVVSKHKSVA